MRRKKMNKKELIESISKKSGLTYRQSERALNSLIQTISNELVNGEVRLTGFGTFALNERAGRQGRNPKTGEAMEIRAKRVPIFRAGSMLKDQVNHRI